MDVFGSFALLLSFVCAVYAFVGGIAAIITRHPLLIKSARQAGIAVCGLIFTATLSLVYLFFTDNYSVAYVVSHSNRDLSTFFKVAALWSGQEGSLLFWSFLLAIYVVSVLLTYRNKNGELMPYVGVILAGVQLFFLTISNFVASPFKALGVANAAGGFDLVARHAVVLDGPEVDVEKCLERCLVHLFVVSGDGGDFSDGIGIFRILHEACSLDHAGNGAHDGVAVLRQIVLARDHDQIVTGRVGCLHRQQDVELLALVLDFGEVVEMQHGIL